jgi:hypothetical protein
MKVLHMIFEECRPTRRQALGLAGGALACLRQGPARAETQVDLQLVLAVDASGSVDQRRFNLQKQGYVKAFQDQRVLAAIRSGAFQSIAVTMFQWTGPLLQSEVIPWMIIRDEATAGAVSRAIAAAPRRIFGGGTSISGAIDFGVTRFARGEWQSDRKVIDISGDGSNNGGRPASRARDEAVSLGITINGLPILSIEPWLEEHFRDEVIGGPGAFLVVARDFESFGEAIVKKLVAEIANAPPQTMRG